MEPADTAWPLEPGSDLVVQLHMLPSLKPRGVKARVGLFFSDRPPARVPFMVKLGSRTIDIPAGEANYDIVDSYVLPVDVTVMSVYPHAHYLAREMKAAATLPDGTVKSLIWIKRWDFHWQDEYRYDPPLLLPKGTRLTMRYTYDNSSGNPHNPHRPPQRVVHGPRSSDEMGDLWLQVLPRDNADLPILIAEYAQRELRAEIAGAEQTTRRLPQDPGAHTFLATRYIQAGRLREAVAELEVALRINPRAADAHSNLGVALQSQDRVKDAVVHFRQAVQFDPKNDRMHLGLANALRADGRTQEAIDQFRQSIALNPDSAEAHSGLGIALGSLDKLHEAVQHLRRSLEINPGDPDTHNNLGVALGLVGARGEALDHFNQALALRPDHEDAQKNVNVLLNERHAGPVPSGGGPDDRWLLG